MAGATDKPTVTEPWPEPAWDVAQLWPAQGQWSEEEYLALNTNRLVEFADGYVEVLPVPTIPHQFIVAFLYEHLVAFVRANRLGKVLFAGVRVRLRPGKFRGPDVVFVRAERVSRMGRLYWDGADLVMEVVSDDPKDRRRDLEIKRQEYAQARIPEYWIVDPHEECITVLRLDGEAYVEHGIFRRGEQATSALLPGFAVEVDAAFQAQV